MNFNFIFTNAILLFFLMDPFGNLPLFVTLLQDRSPREYRRIVIRECLISLCILFLCAFFGGWFMQVMGLSSGILRLSGGLILLILGIRMIFSSIVPPEEAAEKLGKEPFIVPLAVPLICGPGTLAMLMTFLHSSEHATTCNVSFSIVFAWLGQGIILLFGKPLAQILGNKVLDALESLMGLLLTALAVGMMIAGIREIYGIPKP